ncbi:MAG: DNA repair protein RadC [Porticoccaceae bacterium]|jgi:DNA repair protein RadC|nr:DNA repair protein RadC [Porticoccaceae bacterium]
MGIKDWPEGERPREKLLQRGAAALSDAELLAIFLRTGTRGLTAVDLARHLVQRFGGLRGLLSADKKTFCEARGLGEAKFVQLQAVLELARRHLGETLARDNVFTSPAAVMEYLQSQIGRRSQEVFVALFLDTRHRLICCEELFFGTIDGASVYPREVVKRALHHQASAVIFGHNHPSGIAEPSRDDEAITRRLKEALALVDIRVLDHVVVGAGCGVSMAERGLI